MKFLALVSSVAAKFLIVSSPNDGKVLYGALPGFSRLATNPDELTAPKDLITNLQAPEGLAVYRRTKLLVSDCKALNIYMYDLQSEGTVLTATGRVTLVQNIPGGARWLAVDSLGNLFYSVEENSEIFTVSATKIMEAAGAVISGTALYQGGSTPAVAKPSGLAADNFFIYWGNKEAGSLNGSVVASYQRVLLDPATMGQEGYPAKLAANENEVFGICLVDDGNVFYTAPNKMYAVRNKGGSIALITDEMTNPRGCTFDGDGSVFVADGGSNAVYQFAAHFGKTLRTVKKMKKVMEVPAPSQVVLVNSAGMAPIAALLGWLLLWS